MRLQASARRSSKTTLALDKDGVPLALLANWRVGSTGWKQFLYISAWSQRVGSAPHVSEPTAFRSTAAESRGCRMCLDSMDCLLYAGGCVQEVKNNKFFLKTKQIDNSDASLTFIASQTALCSLTKRACKIETPTQLLRTSPDNSTPFFSCKRRPSSPITSFPST